MLVKPARHSSSRKSRSVVRPTLEILEDRLAPAVVSWNVNASGSWNVASNWIDDQGVSRLPGPDDDVVIDRPAGVYTITVSTGTQSVRSIVSAEALTVSGGTLTVANSVQVSNTFTLSGGTLRTATVAAGTTLIGTGSATATLDGVTIDGNMTFTGSSPRVSVQNGLTLNGTATLASSSGYARLVFQGTQTLGGTGQVVFGSNSQNALQVFTAGTTLTIGPNVTVRGQNGYIGYVLNPNGGSENVHVVNQGTVRPDVSSTAGVIVRGQSFTNEGTIGAANGGKLTLNTITGGNLGAVSLSGGTLETASFRTVNVPVTVGAGSTLTFDNNWSNTSTLTVAAGGTVNLGGTMTLASIGDFRHGGGTVNLTGTLNNQNTTFGLGDLAGSYRLVGGTIVGGTVADTVTLHSTTTTGTLQGVTVDGNLLVSTTSSKIEVRNGLTLNGTANLAASSGSSGLRFIGTQTLGGTGTVVFGSGNANGLQVFTAGTTLTIGPGITVRGQRGVIGATTLGTWGGSTNVHVVNQGTIRADVPLGSYSFSVVGLSFTNQGLIAASNGGTLTVNATTIGPLGNTAIDGGTLEVNGAFTVNQPINVLGAGVLSLEGTYTVAAPITVAASGTLTLEGNPLNSSTITATDATVNLGGTFTLARLGDFRRVGGTVNLTGTLDNRNTTLALNFQTGPWQLRGGTILGGRVTTANGVQLRGTNTDSTLDGVTLDGELVMAGGTRVTVVNGMTLNGWVLAYGGGSRFQFAGTQTLSGTGQVLLGTASSGSGQLVVTQSNTTLTIGQGITIRGTQGTIGGLNNSALIDVINYGTIRADGFRNGTAIDLYGRSFTNHGTIEAVTNGVLDVWAPVTLVGAGRMNSDLTGTVNFYGPLPTGITNPARFTLNGLTWLHSGGVTRTAANPRLHEVMGEDRGSSLAGFTSNFALGALKVQAGYVRLVDQLDNAPGTGAEALYVDALEVTGGSTLDLNGLRVYTRSLYNWGTIVGGTVTVLPDGGPIVANVPTRGRISATGEMDEWTFYGRQGQSVAVAVTLGSTTLPKPLPIAIQFATVSLLDADGNVLRTANSPSSSTSFRLSDVILPADGIYRIQVRQTNNNATGNYMLTLEADNVGGGLLALGEWAYGGVGTLVSQDEWHFSAVPGQQIQFDSRAPEGMQFRLSRQGATVVADLTAGSGLVTLTQGGAYTVTVSGPEGVMGDYAFRLSPQPQVLTLNVPFDGNLVANGQYQLFRIEVPETTPLQFVLEGGAAVNRNALYAQRGTPPTRLNAEYRTYALAASQQLTVPLAHAGTWYVLVHSSVVAAPGGFRLTASPVPVLVSSSSPPRASAATGVTLTVNGAGFAPGVVVDLVATDGTSHGGTVTALAHDRLTVSFAPGAMPAGIYAMRVTRPDGASAERAAVLELLAGGLPRLQTRVDVPSTLGNHLPATVFVEYANHGDAAMPAPVLVLNVGARGILTLDPTLAGGFWTSEMPDGYAHSVQILASGATPGVLQPGEVVRVPVYWGGRLTPWVNMRAQIDFTLTVSTQDQTDPIDWASLGASLRPSHVTPAAWNVIADNLAAQVGPTWGDYVRMLNDNAAYLGRLGLHVTDVGELFNFELLQAAGLHPIDTVAESLDSAVEAPGLGLGFGRSYANSPLAWHQVGLFGRGWHAPWEQRLVVESDLSVYVTGAGGSQRRFQRDKSLAAVRYAGAPGDNGVVTRRPDGTFELREADGLLRRFRADGRIDYLEDLNGNRVTAQYTGSRITRLLHSSGQFIDVTYNAQGRIAGLTDSEGETVAFSYDASGEYLLSAQYHDGRTVSYTYQTTPGAAQHALTSIQSPTGVTRVYEYDAAGRISATSLNAGLTTGAQRVDFLFDSAGTVRVQDAVGSNRLFYDHRGLLVQHEDALGRVARQSFDDAYNLTSFTDALGQQVRFSYDARGNLTRAVDQVGGITTYAYGRFVSGVNIDRMTAVTDARGNTTRFSYDARGNASGLTHTNGASEVFMYDAWGNVQSATSRAGAVTSYTRNVAGQVVTKTYSDGSTVAATYDARGNLATLTDASGVTAFTYDTGNRLTRVAYPDGRSIDYTYDEAGRRIRTVDQDGFTVNYHYDGLSRLDSLTDGAGGLIVRYTYDVVGRMVRKDLGAGGHTTYTHDAAGQLLSLVNHAPGGTVTSRFDYSYDVLGRRTGMVTLDGAWAYEYDPVGQLTRAVFTSATLGLADQDLRYVYDTVGNRVRTVINGVTTEYVVNNMNQYVRVGDDTYTYDADGNLTSITTDAGTYRFAYDNDSQLVRVTTPADEWLYEYDALGNRKASVTGGARTEYLVDPYGIGVVVGSYTGGVATQYIHAFGLVSRVIAGAAQSYDFDGLGSVVGLSDAAGTVLNRYAYSPFGERLLAQEGVANPFQFVGRFGVMSEGNGLEFMRARFYSTQTGRFTAPDPIGFAGGSINLYAYVHNQPTNFIDPTGYRVLVPVGNGHGVQLPSGARLQEVTIDGDEYIVIYKEPDGTEVTIQGKHDDRGDLEQKTTWNEDTKMSTDSMLDSQQERVGPQGAGNGGVNSGGGSQGGGSSGGGSSGGGSGSGGSGSDGSGGGGGTGSPAKKKPKRRRKPKPLPPPLPPPDPNHPGGDGNSGSAGAVDPNQKVAPGGFGTANFVRPDALLLYRVDFENDPAANAPAQVVEVFDPLDPRFDRDTFEFTGFGFGDLYVPVPVGTRAYRTAVPFRHEERDIEVEVTLDFDPAEGHVFATFRAYDPLTNQPLDVLTGFLPPEDGTGRGQGFFTYAVRLVPGLPTGAAIRNVATIRFDYAEVINTNQVDPHDPSQGTDPNLEALVTVDAVAPTSSIDALPSTLYETTFTLSWSGSDDVGGSGIVAYDVYVAENGGAFNAFLLGTTLTSTTFNAVNGNTYAFYSVATDGVGHRQPTPADPQVTVEVRVNIPPVLDSIGNRSVNEGSALSFTISATDADEQPEPLMYAATNLPLGASFDPVTRVFTWTPNEAQGPGSYQVTFTVSDGAAIDSETITVTVNEVNQPPVLNPIGNRSVDEGQLLTFTISATDPDLPADTLTYSAGGLPVGASFNPQTRTFTWTPTEAQGPGSFDVTFTVSDGAATDSETVTITVNEVNQAPVLAPVGNRTTVVGQLLSFTLTATDADLPANTLTYSATGLPEGATFNPQTRTFAWTPTEAQGPGSFNVTFTVNDGILVDSETVAITVNGATPPVLPLTVPPPAPPAPLPPPVATGIVIASVRRGRTRRLMIRVPFSDGRLAEFISPFQANLYRGIQAVLSDPTSGSVLVTARRIRDGRLIRRTLSV